LIIAGTASISGNSLQLTFAGLPDVPLTRLELVLNGGSGSILTVGNGLCSGPQTVGGQLASQSGATVPVNSGLSLSGCRNFGPGLSKPTAFGASFSGLATGRPKLHFQSSSMSSVSIALPRGLSFSRPFRGRGLSLSGARLKSMRLSHGRLLITLRAQTARVGVTITGPLLKESAGLPAKVKGRQIKTGVVSLKLTGSAGQTSLSPKLKFR